LRQIKEVNILI